MSNIFIHGLGQNASSWDQTIAHLGNGADMACPDLFSLLGDRSCTYDNLYSVFSRYCKKQNKPLTLCGLSLGAVLALNYALDHQANVRSLILIGAQYKMPRTLLRVQNVAFRLMPNAVFKSMGISKSNAIRLTESMSTLDFSDRLKSISCPTLVICGEKDKANMKGAQGLADNIKNAKLHIVEGTGHELNTQAPTQLADVIRYLIQ